MSVANSGLVPKPQIVKSIPAIAAIASGAVTPLCTIIVPGTTAYSYSAQATLTLVADTAGASITGGGVQTRTEALANFPAGSFLSSDDILGGPVITQPRTANLHLSGFIYNVTSIPTTVVFAGSFTTSAGTYSIVNPTNMFFTEAAIAGFSV